jgi:hypothetical protein
VSAYGIGADTATVEDGGRTNTANTNVPATIVKWIPGEAITFYAAIIGIGAAQGPLTGSETPKELLERITAGSFGWFAAGALVAVALVITGALSQAGEPKKRLSMAGLVVRVLLSLVAFALWTSALPGSWTYSLNFIRNMGAAYALLLIPLGLVFAGLAEWLTKKFQL